MSSASVPLSANRVSVPGFTAPAKRSIQASFFRKKAKRTNANTEKHHGASAVWHVDGQVIEGNLCAIKRVISLVMSSARKNTKFHGIDSAIAWGSHSTVSYRPISMCQQTKS